MNPKIALKIFVDAVMLIAYLQLTFFYYDNPLYHEVVGIGIGVVCLLHVVLNWKPTVALAKRVAYGQARNAQKLQLALDIALVVFMAAAIVTGVLVARCLFIGPAVLALDAVHNVVSYVCLGVICAHALQHVKYLAGVFREKKSSPARARASVSADRAAAMRAARREREAVSRRAFLRKTVLGGAGVFALASFVVLEHENVATTLGFAQNSTISAVAQTQHDELEVNDASASETQSSASSSASSGAIASSQSSSSASSSSSAGSSGSTSAAQPSASTANVTCPMCKKKCPVSNLRCNLGVQWATENDYR